MTAPMRPAPRPGIYDEPYWSYAALGELRLPRCSACGELRYPPGPACPSCLSPDHTWEPLSGRGTLLAWTVFHRTYFPDIPVPYVVVAVRTADGPVLIGNLLGGDVTELVHDQPMRARFQDVLTPDGPARLCQWAPESSSEET